VFRERKGERENLRKKEKKEEKKRGLKKGVSLETCNHLILDNNTMKIRLTHIIRSKRKN
jgi:hypothetical protein